MVPQRARGSRGMLPGLVVAICLWPAISGLVGCSVGPDYVRPETDAPIPDAWNNAIETELSDPAADMRNWWVVFDDSILTQLITAAEMKNRDLLVAIDGRPTTGGGQLRAQVVNTAPGTTITLDVIRQGDRIQVRATLGST